MGALPHLFDHFSLSAFRISAAASSALVSAVWEGTVLAASVALCLHFVKGISAGIRSFLWMGVLLLIVLLHFVPLFNPMLDQAASQGKTLHVGIIWSLVLAGVWAILSLVRGAQLVHSIVALRRIGRRAKPVPVSLEWALLLRANLRSAQLCTTADVDRPSVIGFFRPRVLIPKSLFEKLSEPELEQILLHEMEHLRRGDDWINFLQKVALALFPLNPVLLWVERRLCIERELACDDHVLQMTNARKAYAACLVHLAEHSVLNRGISLALGAWEKQSELGRRVRRILLRPEGVMAHRPASTIASALTLAMLGGAIALSREPQLVSFEPASVLQATAIPVPPLQAYPANARKIDSAPGLSYAPVTFRDDLRSPHMVETVYRGQPVSASQASSKPPQPVSASASRASAIPSPAAKSVSASRSHASARERLLAETAHPATRHEVTPRAWVVLTDWTVMPEPPQVHLLVSPQTRSTYAAIPTWNGWLIVQL